MGYQTNYSLKSSPKIEESILIDQLEVITLYSFDEYSGDICLDAKWYDHEDHMKSLSKVYPDVLFTLHGEGEDEDDKWNKYFKNGKMQACYAEITIVYEPFNEAELK